MGDTEVSGKKGTKGSIFWVDDLAAPLITLRLLSLMRGGQLKTICFVLCIVVLGTLAKHANAGLIFSDDYSSNSLANYDAAEQPTRPTFQHTGQWAVDTGNGVLTYSRTSTGGFEGTFFTADLLVKQQIATTAGLGQFTVSGQFNGGLREAQPGLVITGDNISGGYELQFYTGSVSFDLLRMTGDQMLGDEGGGQGGQTSPQPLAKYTISPVSAPIDGHSYQVSVTFDRTGDHPVITTTLIDLTNGFHLADQDQVTDLAEPANYGGDQFGWRLRTASDNLPAFSLDNLALSPEPSGSLLAVLAAMGLLSSRPARK